PIYPKTIVDLIKTQASRIPDRIALQMVNEGEWEAYTYAETYTRSRAVAWRLWESGLRKGDRVVLVSENQPGWCIAYLAAAQIGLAVVPLDAQTPADEILAIVAFTTAKSILASDAVLEKSGAVLSEAGTLLQNINNSCEIVGSEPVEKGVLTREIPADFPNVEISADTVASIIFTMGTTVDAKGAMLTHGGFLSNVQAVAKALPPTDTERILSALPLYHALSFSCSLLMALYSGTTATYVNALRPTTLLKTMREAKTTAFIGVPRLFQLLQSTIERQAAREDTPGETLAEKAKAVMGGEIRVLVSGGASLSDAIYDGFQKLGMTIYQGYGMTETAPVLTVNPYEKSKRASVGPAVEGVELRIENPDADGVGEIVAKGPSTMTAYYQNPTATAAAVRDGWLYTGDLGYMDADGYLYLTGHCKDVIVPASGKNVYPLELEALYRESAAISEICVVGVPYEDGSDTAIHAVIVPTSPDETTKAAIQHHLHMRAKELPSYQQFHKFHFWEDALPKTQKGGIDRQHLKCSLQTYIENTTRLHETPEAAAMDAGSPTPRTNIPQEVLSTLSRLARMPAHEIRLESRLDIDLGLDSLTRLDLLLILEARLGETIPDALLANLETVGDVVKLIETFQSDVKRETEPLDDFGVRSACDGVELRQVPRWYARAFRSVITGIYRNYFSLKCYGLEHIPQGKPYIIMPNHTSHLDTLTVITALGKRAYQLWVLAARDYWFATRLQGWFAGTCLNALPIEREGNFTEFLQDLRMANAVMAENNGLLIFPEGTRSLDGDLQPFKSGILSLLIYGPNVPIIPTYIDGTYHALPKGQNLPKKHPVRIIFGEPLTFPPEGWGDPDETPIDPDKYQEFLELAQHRVAALGAALKQQKGA
ncbi:MAG: AMP-binding protein, partial [Candidatus Poribacteria bacterium]|nr:AMP-binding protein [Candidatus Poribacteria bacterium]